MRGIIPLGITDLFQIAFLAIGIYYLLRSFRGTRSAQVFLGLVTLLASMIFLTHLFSLDVLSWMLRTLSVYLAVAVVVIFQPEIRRALADLGRRPLFTSPEPDAPPAVDGLVQAVTRLAHRRIGALLALERQISLRGYEETGTALGAPVIPELLVSIFHPQAPLHDGGVIIRENLVAAAGCVFPLSSRGDLQRGLGTRHRAAVGLSEETDAVVVVVSEETGIVSAAFRGRLLRKLKPEQLHRFIERRLVSEEGRDRASGDSPRFSASARRRASPKTEETDEV